MVQPPSLHHMHTRTHIKTNSMQNFYRMAKGVKGRTGLRNMAENAAALAIPQDHQWAHSRRARQPWQSENSRFQRLVIQAHLVWQLGGVWRSAPPEEVEDHAGGGSRICNNLWLGLQAVGQAPEALTELLRCAHYQGVNGLTRIACISIGSQSFNHGIRRCYWRTLRRCNQHSGIFAMNPPPPLSGGQSDNSFVA